MYGSVNRLQCVQVSICRRGWMAGHVVSSVAKWLTSEKLTLCAAKTVSESAFEWAKNRNEGSMLSVLLYQSNHSEWIALLLRLSGGSPQPHKLQLNVLFCGIRPTRFPTARGGFDGFLHHVLIQIGPANKHNLHTLLYVYLFKFDDNEPYHKPAVAARSSRTANSHLGLLPFQPSAKERKETTDPRAFAPMATFYHTPQTPHSEWSVRNLCKSVPRTRN